MSTSTLAMPDKNRVLYNFWRGHPNNHLLPVVEMQQILEHMSSASNQERLRDSLQYLSSDRGDPVLLKEISLFLRRHTLEDDIAQQSTTTALTEASNDEALSCELDMFLTHGVSHGLDMLCTTQTTPGDVVLIERPSYFLAAGIFQSHGLKIESLPMKRQSEDGALMVDVEAFSRGLEDGSIRVPRMIYIVPTNQNPTASTISITDRWKMCRLARRYGFLIAADEVYHLLDWRDDKKQRPARFSVVDHILSKECKSSGVDSSLDEHNKRQIGCAVSVSSFTKIFTPGVRCGWIEGPTDIIDSIVDLGYIQSQGGCAPFVGNIVRTALEEGFQDRILERLNESYKERCQILCDVLQSEPGIQLCYRPTGGYFVWVDFLDLPGVKTLCDGSSGSDSPASVFARFCFDRGLKFMPGIKCDSVFESFEQSKQPKELCQNSARLCFADMDLDDVEDGARMLVDLYREYTGKATPSFTEK
eukprot:CAMPEP_0116117666 /NCGR_PEP_ID=MMETSP0329-20121206/1693_1 /TAXON_ID=697910 /ORGANISM="Pseudo-nitzschia arenysensis, Strain B593" /LENGTH=473 /DNA_ID=CAMNT_0003611243 /DNA_START=142 /DNA_END=1563 /DNA_ORIENTATION=+